MDTFGERLEHERKDRGLTNQAVSESVGVDAASLAALERNDFGALPNEAVMMDCLNRYSELLEVDAELMIADYSQERERYLKELQRASAAPVAGATARTVPSLSSARSRFSPAVAVLLVVAIVLAAWWIFTRGEDSPEPEASVATAPAEAESAASSPPAEASSTPTEAASQSDESPSGDGSGRNESSETPLETLVEPDDGEETPPIADSSPGDQSPTSTEPTPGPVEQSEPAPTRTGSANPSLSVTEYGVGTAVENHRLIGENDRFEEGTRVAFWTRVEGAAPGDWIDHVWYMEGQVVARRKLEIGGPNWRTHTVKTIDGGVGSVWVVEARDATGRVLARSEFISSP